MAPLTTTTADAAGSLLASATAATPSSFSASVMTSSSPTFLSATADTPASVASVLNTTAADASAAVFESGVGIPASGMARAFAAGASAALAAGAAPPPAASAVLYARASASAAAAARHVAVGDAVAVLDACGVTRNPSFAVSATTPPECVTLSGLVPDGSGDYWLFVRAPGSYMLSNTGRGKGLVVSPGWGVGSVLLSSRVYRVTPGAFPVVRPFGR